MVAALVAAAAFSLPAGAPPDLSVAGHAATVKAQHGSSCTTSSGASLCADMAFPPPDDPASTLHVAAGETLTLQPDPSATVDSSGVLSQGGAPLGSLGSGPQIALPAPLPGVSYLTVGTRWRSDDANGQAANLVKLVRDVPPVAVPEITVSGRTGTMKTTALGGCQQGGGMSVCGLSPVPWEVSSLPALRAAAGEKLTVSADKAVSSLTGTVTDGKGHTLATLSGSTMTLPARLPARSWLVLKSKWTRDGVQGDGPSALRLELAPAALAKAGAIRHGTTRVRWTVTCPKSAGLACAGTSSVRVHGRLVARRAFEALAAGEHRDLSALIGPPAKRYLRNHPAATLKATVRR